MRYGIGGRALLSAGTTLGAAGVAFGAVAPPEHCPAATAGSVHAAATETVGWFVRNQNPDGTWLYEYDADTTTVTPSYNTVRHAGATTALYQAATGGIGGAMEAADRGVAWAMDNVVEVDDWAALGDPGSRQIPVGATALLVTGLVERRQLTGDQAHDRALRLFGNFLARQVEPSGAYLGFYDLDAAAPVPGAYSKYYTGEAYWALARLHGLFPEEPYGAVADRIGEYLATARDDREDYWPPLADHWAAYGLSETVTFSARRGPDGPLTDDEVAYAREQAGYFGGRVRWFSQRQGPWGRWVRGATVPRGGVYGVTGEGLTGLWRVSLVDDRLGDLRTQIAQRAACNAGLTIEAQSDPAEAAAEAEPDRVRGAWFRDGVTRMDDQQHALSSLLRTEQILRRGDASRSGRAGPGNWLLLAALVAALNPIRVARSTPRSGRTHTQVALLVAIAGLATAVAAGLLALISGPLLDALDVSSPAFRLAAGVVVAAAGVADLVRHRAPETDIPATPQRRDALLPMLVWLLLRPALIILAVSAGADGGVVLVLLATVLATAVAALLARLADGRTAAVVLAWASQLIGAAAIATGILLMVDGILDV